MTEPSGYSAFHIEIFGRVQGVAFRYSTQREAQRRGLSGWVKNLFDGSVEVVCEGETQKVRDFTKWLKKGPPGAYVTEVVSIPMQYTGKYNKFSIEF